MVGVRRWRSVTLALAAALIVPASASATFPGKNGLIAFQNDVVGGIYTIHSDGTHREKLGDGFEPSWSADGKRIVIVRDVGPTAKSEVFTMKADGSDVRRITHSKGSKHEPAFSPGGKSIVFRKGKFRGGSGTLFTMKANGKHLTKLGKGEDADWSPEIPMGGGSRIALARFGPASPCSPSTYSFTMKPNGHDLQSLGFDCANNSEPSWSPNTLSMAAAVVVSGTTDIFTTPSFFNGKSIRLTDLAGNDDDPAWSPNGKEVAFGHDDGNGGLYVVSPSSPQNETAIPHTASVNGAYPAWQPR